MANTNTYQVLDKMIEKLATKAKDVDDYVVESGTSGSWTYQKYNSGKCVAWYYASHKCTFTATTVTGIYSSPDWEAAVPGGLFSATPVVTVAAKSSGAVLTDISSASSKDKIYIHMTKFVSGGEYDVMMQLQCIGVWK